jgi:ribosomal RNA adenine dimethylase
MLAPSSMNSEVCSVQIPAWSTAVTCRERFAEAPVTVIQTDALSLRLPHRPFRVVASPPYAISSALRRVLLGSRSRLTAADLVLQRAVVRRHVDRWHATAGPRIGGGTRGPGEPSPVTPSTQHHRSTRLSWSFVAGKRLCADIQGYGVADGG